MRGMCSPAGTSLLWLEQITNFNRLTHGSSLNLLLISVFDVVLFFTIPLFVPAVTLPCPIHNSTSMQH